MAHEQAVATALTMLFANRVKGRGNLFQLYLKSKPFPDRVRISGIAMMFRRRF